jgi:hypothetical protein
MSSLNMTGTDGGKLITPVLALGVMSIFLLVPITPFIHRVTHHVPMFLLCIFIGTFIYNLVVFPFSDSHRFKYYFQQRLDLDHDTNTVTITGLEHYSRMVINTLPIASGQEIKCVPSLRSNLQDCEFDGSALSPKLVKGKSVNELLSLKSLTVDSNKVVVQIDAIDTRVCHIYTNRSVRSFVVEGAAQPDERFGKKLSGLQRIDLWRRDRDRPWNVTINLEPGKSDSEFNADGTEEEKGLKDRTIPSGDAAASGADTVDILLTCLWSDANRPGTIPMLDDLHRYMPTWATVSKSGVGLVEVYKQFYV